MPVSRKEFLDIQGTIGSGFTLKRVRDMINIHECIVDTYYLIIKIKTAARDLLLNILMSCWKNWVELQQLNF